jgi:hypothetical protein
MLVFEFLDGATLPLFDGLKSSAENLALWRAVEAERRRRRAAGISAAGTIAVRFVGQAARIEVAA